MRKSLFLVLIVLALFSVQAGASGFKVIVPDTTDAGEILVGTPFTIDFYGVNDDAGMLGASLPFELYSPDVITTITHVNVGGISPYIPPSSNTWEDSSITVYNDWNKDGFWTMFDDWSGWSWDGTLPDTVNFSGITMSEWSVSDTTLYFKFHLQIDQEGTFCIDSIDHSNNTYDWLFDFPVSFGGPHCWSIVSPSVLAADFTADVTSGEYPLTVQFTDLSTGSPTSWDWDFGDGVGTSILQNPQYTYADPGKGSYTVTLTVGDGVSTSTETKTDFITAYTDVKEVDKELLPTEFALGQNYPNPFNMQTRFEFALPKQSTVNVAIYNVIGQKIKTLADGEFEAGYWEVNWDGTSDYGIEVASGLYFYKIETEQFKDTKKLMLLK